MLIGSIGSVMLLHHVSAGKGPGSSTPVATSVLTDVEEADLLFMREEEKLAHDVYVVMYGSWSARVFSNISWSEQNHMNAMLRLLNQYNLPDPAVGFGVFYNEELQALFDSLIERGLQSRLEALLVGALIEEVDIRDISAAMEHTDQKDILTVYGNLLAGSKKHLIAFVRNIEAITGVDYEAQHISQEEVDDILGR
jgi:hypothetical protein